MQASTGPGPRQEPELSGWALGGVAFAGFMLILIGAFQATIGFAAIFEDDFFVVGRAYAYDIDVTAWGWAHLALGVLLLLIGLALLAGQGWAALVAIVLALLSAIANFLFIPYYPFWAIVVIAVDIWVIWALTRWREVVGAGPEGARSTRSDRSAATPP
ncbi:MAG: hypothetical protein WD399_07310 [Thermoleophilaceae bacterium]